ncbi:MAG: zinc-binding dehydrogenase, partial [Acidimicrobiia bacterium]|nr:zinc-binding dehydrogenase [Acidimicrobiia bacterium]
ALGATPIDYQTEDFVERIRALTGDGVDLVVDTVGGAMHLLRSYRTLRTGGRLVWLGSAATETQGLRAGPLSMLAVYLLKAIPDRKQIPICPTTNKFALADNDWYRNTLTELLGLLATGVLEPVVSERIPLAEAARAHDTIERGAHTGKIVLVTDGTPAGA